MGLGFAIVYSAIIGAWRAVVVPRLNRHFETST
jgi:hypothetical protein